LNVSLMTSATSGSSSTTSTVRPRRGCEGSKGVSGRDRKKGLTRICRSIDHHESCQLSAPCGPAVTRWTRTVTPFVATTHIVRDSVLPQCQPEENDA
jgi:hypothetical protein